MSDPKPASDDDAFHRLTSRLATLDLDPATLEILTAVLTADLSGDRPGGFPPPAG
jgi:hypothetical protein